MNTANEAIAKRIYEIKSEVIELEKKEFDSKRIGDPLMGTITPNERQHKFKLLEELKKISEKHFEDPFVRIGKAGRGANE